MQINDTFPFAFALQSATGDAINADATPTGVLRKNGVVVSGASITIGSTGTTGEYTATVVFASADGWAIGDRWTFRVSYAIAGKNQNIPWSGLIRGDAYAKVNTALPNVAAGANGGLPLGDASGRVLLQPTQAGVTIPNVTTTGVLTDKNNFLLASQQTYNNVGQLANLPVQVKGLDTDTINANAVASSAVVEFQNGLSTLTAQQVWEYVTRSLTSGGGGATPQQVWEYASRSLTDKAGFGLASSQAFNNTGQTANIPTQVKGMDTDTLTASALATSAVSEIQSGLSTLTAQQVWEYVTRSLTTSSGGGVTPQQVWEYATRTLTDKSGYSLANTQAFNNTGQTSNVPAQVKGMDADTVTAAALASSAVNEVQNGLSTLTPQQAQDSAAAALNAYDPPTRAEATADRDYLGAKIDAVQAGSGPSVEQIADGVWTRTSRTLTSGGGGGGGDVDIQPILDALATLPAEVLDAILNTPNTVDQNVDLGTLFYRMAALFGGKTDNANTAQPDFYNMNNTEIVVTAQYDENGNRNFVWRDQD